MKRAFTLMAIFAVTTVDRTTSSASGPEPRSQPITAVLREPLPPERLQLSSESHEIVIQGPSFRYALDKASGIIVALQVEREGHPVLRLVEPARLVIGPYSLDTKHARGSTAITSQSDARIVLKTEGTLKSSLPGDLDLPFTVVSNFFNDGVVVAEWTLRPAKDLALRELRHEVVASGPFRHYLHKTRDRDGFDAPWGSLPKPGGRVGFSTRTSCLQVFGPRAGLALFTDRGATHASGGGETALVAVKSLGDDLATVSLAQYLVRDAESGPGLVLKANTPFTFRAGVSVVPNRLPHPRQRDLRMFTWVGDEKHPYPSDKEIHDAAQLGFTLFQMHRLGTPGEPRPPAGELNRVIDTVHRAGMLFLWTANADLMYACAPRVREMQAQGKWRLWQGFNYGGRYTAPMDRYCDLLATCLASPNGLADYRIQCDANMMDRYQVDGMYIDDNLAYANCTLAKEHHHPEQRYDCLIELHEMNWRRRQLLRARCPHAVLVDHCTTAMVLPVICDFDAHLYGEGYSFSAAETYWAQFGWIRSMHAQGFIWPGDDEPQRCATQIAYNYDLLTGGGQYTYLDWRLYPQKFPYAKGVSEDEARLVREYNLAQFYFGMYESAPHVFAESAHLFSTRTPRTHATIYKNCTWNDYLVVVANMNSQPTTTSLVIRSPGALGIQPEGRYVLLDLHQGAKRTLGGGSLAAQGFEHLGVPPHGLRLFYVRELRRRGPHHLWGGKRISEKADAPLRRVTIELHGPPGVEETVLIGNGDWQVREVRADGKSAPFFFDPQSQIIHGKIIFGAQPVRIEIEGASGGKSGLPQKSARFALLASG